MYGGVQQGGDGRAGMMGYVHAAQQHQMMMQHHHMQQQQYHNMGGDTGSVTSATSRSESESDRSIQSDRSSAVSSGVAQQQMQQQRPAQQQPHADAQGSGGWYGGQRGIPAGAGAAGHAHMRPQAADAEYNARYLPRAEMLFFFSHVMRLMCMHARGYDISLGAHFVHRRYCSEYTYIQHTNMHAPVDMCGGHRHRHRHIPDTGPDIDIYTETVCSRKIAAPALGC
jgi:hypothetical protein